MKKAILFSLLLSGVFLLAACSKSHSDEEPTPPETGEMPNWQKPLKVTEYYGANGINSITIYTYDMGGRLLGYQKKSDRGYMQEEMLNSQYSGNTHSYEVHSYEWAGCPLPVVFLHTDTYTDDSFTALQKQLRIGRNMDIKETMSYTYKDGKLASYRMDNEGTYSEVYTTELIYRTGVPSKESFPATVSSKTSLHDIIYEDENGNRTGYYTEGDYNKSGRQRKEWNFQYNEGSCTFYRENILGTARVDVIFYVQLD